MTEAETAVPAASLPLFLPFIHGGPPAAPLGGSWIGLRGEHRRAHLLHAVMEGVAFSHRAHMDALRSRMVVTAPVRVGGGGASSTSWTQLVADSLGLTVEVTDTTEVSALGAAVLAGVGVGAYADVEDGVRRTVRAGRRQEPREEMQALLDIRYQRFVEATQMLSILDRAATDGSG